MSTEGLADKIIGRIADLMSEEDLEFIVKALIGIAHGLADQRLGPTKASNLIPPARGLGSRTRLMTLMSTTTRPCSFSAKT